MSERGKLYQCKHCYYYTPRYLMYCFDCGVKLPDKEVDPNAQDNNPMPDAKRLPRSYKKFN